MGNNEHLHEISTLLNVAMKASEHMVHRQKVMLSSLYHHYDLNIRTASQLKTNTITLQDKEKNNSIMNEINSKLSNERDVAMNKLIELEKKSREMRRKMQSIVVESTSGAAVGTALRRLFGTDSGRTSQLLFNSANLSNNNNSSDDDGISTCIQNTFEAYNSLLAAAADRSMTKDTETSTQLRKERVAVREANENKEKSDAALVVIQNKLKLLENEKQKLISKFDENKMNNEIELKKSQAAAKEYMNRVSLLENEIRSSHALTSELRQTATDAEGVCLELENKLSLMETQSNNTLIDMNNIRNELNQSNSRKSKLEVEIERMNVAMSSIVSDNEALNSIRLNLEDELEHTRQQLKTKSLHVQSTVDKESRQRQVASFELMKLATA